MLICGLDSNQIRFLEDWWRAFMKDPLPVPSEAAPFARIMKLRHTFLRETGRDVPLVRYPHD